DKRMVLSIGALVIVVLGCAGLYAVWQKSSEKKAVAAETEIVRPAAAKSQTEARTDFSPKPVIPASASPAATSPAAAAQPESQPQTQPAVQNVALQTPAASTGRVSELQVAANEPTWIEVTINGKTVFNGMLQRGQSQDLRNTEAARILVGNAGGVAMRWNGKD